MMMQRGYNIVSNGTDNHLFLVNLSNKSITGKDAEIRLGLANITLNKNTVPNETRSPFITSGLRIGTPAMTTRGFKINEAEKVAGWICDVLDNMGTVIGDQLSDDIVLDVKNKVIELCREFPVYKGIRDR